MKKVKNIILSITALIALSSCSDSFVEENPPSEITPDGLLTTEAGAQVYLNGAYGAIQHTLASGGGGTNAAWQIHWGTIATDEVVVPGWAGDRKLMFLQQVTPSNNTVLDVWQELYEAVNIANSVIDRIGAMTEDQINNEAKEKMIAEAKFCRAAAYFGLVVPFENIPLHKNETVTVEDAILPQSSAAEVYEFIISDLKVASAVLPEEQGGAKATKGAAQALLGKVYLQMTGFPLNQTDKFALAEKEFEDVIRSGVYDLLDNYADVFKLDFEQSAEIVYAFPMDGPGQSEGGNLSTFYGPNGAVSNGGGWGTCYINQEFETSYDRDDLRLRNNVAVHNANDMTREEAVEVDPNDWGTNKVSWRGWKTHAEKPNAYANDTPFDNPYIRYSDVLLMYAEALNGQGKLTQIDIDQTVNRLRSRVRNIPSAVPDMVLGTQEQNAEEILSERRKELCFEGWRRNDLIRFGKYKETILAIDQGGWSTAGNPGPNYEDFEIRWPIPSSELEINPNLIQNEGY
ncbi:RagB/SusD family nutrient uptake outer membrane protein [uncultured Maribacter sp.]|uniref:RagB/SusD family nutrient uptake outer membrane protein n=1 Tax=uncultured Maribacter sp. TaxID=431308 RepID=UPI002611B915|nr:RagB/SusD family nutrient uptake outer membrane protein [uncultured Maribacter sp.]